MPSYTQYKRQMAVMDADDANIETWITVKGNHIPIMKGQSKEEAVQAFLEKKGGKTDLTTKKGPKGETLFASKKELKNASLSNLGKDPKGIKPAILESGAKTVMKPDVEKPGSTTVVSKGSGKAKYKVGDVTKQGKIKEVIPARLSDTPYYKLENGKTYLEEELHAEKPAEKLGKKRSLSNGGFTIGLSKKEHEKIEKYNKEAAKYDDIYKGDKAAFEKINRILAGKGTKEDTETLVANIESTLGKEAGAKAREKYASILNPTPKGEKPAKVNPLEPQTKEQARLWLADTLASTEGFTEANFSKEDKAMLKKMDEKFGEGWWETKSSKPAKKSDDIMSWPFNKVMELPGDDPRVMGYLKQHHAKWKANKEAEKIETLKNKIIDDIAGDVGSQDFTQLIARDVERELAESEKTANKGWQNARSGHPETIGKVVRRVVKKMGEARDVPDVHSEYKSEIARLQNKAARMRKMGQGATAIKLEEQAEKLYKEMRELDD